MTALRPLRPHQQSALDDLRRAIREGARRPVVQAVTGFGKCLGIGTPVMRYDGRIVPVENVVRGDLLMGPDGCPRRVLSTCRSSGPLYRIVPVKGEPWVCNDVHVLTLVSSRTGRIVDIPLNEYLGLSKGARHVLKLFSPPEGVDFEEGEDPDIDPYFLGVWLGDGSKLLNGVGVSKPDQEVRDLCSAVADRYGLSVRVDGTDRGCPTYHIHGGRSGGQSNPLLLKLREMFGRPASTFPHSVRTASRLFRQEFLAGVIDSDGYVIKNCVEIAQKNPEFAEGIVFVARSLGLRAVCKPKTVGGVVYQRIGLSGDFTGIVTRIPRKRLTPRKQIKVATRSGFRVESIGIGDYAGFELDCDGRFLLGDFTVTHNTVLAAHIVAGARAKHKRVAFCVPTLGLVDQTFERFLENGIDAADMGVIQSDHPWRRPHAPIQIATAQTLARRSLPEVDVVVVDECFAAGTQVETTNGPVAIEKICVGDVVRNALGWGAVEATTCRKPGALVRVTFSNGDKIVCTPNHPFFTDIGWVRADDLLGRVVFGQRDIDAIRSQASSEELAGVSPSREGEQSLRILRRGVCAEAAAERGGAAAFRVDQAKVLFNLLLEESRESDGHSIGEEEVVGDVAADRAQAERSMGEWLRSDEAAGCVAGGTRTGMGSRVRASHGSEEREWTGDSLQARSSEREPESEHRGGREYTLRQEQAAGYGARCAVAVVGVDSIAGEELAGFGDVFNLQVGGHPSYFAEGILVHNCHVQFGIYERWMKESPALFIGLSATPWAKGMGKKWDRLIKSTPMSDLIDMGYLSPFRVFAPSIPNLDGIATVAGDYHEGQLADRMNKPTLVADIVTTWIDRGEDRPTLCFATGRDHAKAIRDRFAEFGIPVAYVDANTPREEREEIGQKLGTGEIKVAVNIGCLTTGIDWDVRCIILARPTKSHSLFTQIIGRGLRTAEGKLDCIILDHSDTHARLGMVTDIDLDELDDGSRKQQEKARKREKSVPLPKCCPACTALMPVGNAACLECGTPLPRRIDVHTVEGDLSEFTGKRKGKKKSSGNVLAELPKADVYGQLRTLARERGHSAGWIAHKYKSIYGVWPKGVLDAPPIEPCFALRQFIRHQNIAWAKSRKSTGGDVVAAE